MYGYNLGEKEKNFDETLSKGNRKDLAKVRSPDQQKWWNPTVLVFNDYLIGQYLGWDDRVNYRGSESSSQRFGRLQPDTNFVRESFFVRANLVAWPGISDFDDSINRNANPSDIRDVKFVILLDGNPEKALHPIIQHQVSKLTGESSYSIPELSQSTTNIQSSGTQGYFSQTSTVTYASQSTQDFTYYTASYDLYFPLFQNGKVTIPRSTKFLEFISIRNGGEHKVKFYLNEMYTPK